MSTIQDTQTIWSVKDNDSRYEKCRNITEEIYKRINLTFQIKKLETAAQSDVSDQSEQIDSNELSNETDLFACDKTSLSSSTEAERQEAERPATGKFININNNEEKAKKPAVVCKRPRKRFRKRVKKRQSKQTAESDASSDEALPLSRIVDIEAASKAKEKREEWESESPDRVMGVPILRLVKVQIGKDIKPKTDPSEKKPTKKEQVDQKQAHRIDNPLRVQAQKVVNPKQTIDKQSKELCQEKVAVDMKGCTLCSLSFRGERGLRRHMTMSHIISPVRSDWNSKPA